MAHTIKITQLDLPDETLAPGIAGKAIATAVITSSTGRVTEVGLSLFMLADGRIGAGVYPSPDRGAVLRWDRGVNEDPVFIKWQAPDPHCADDLCGAPCGHQREPWWRRWMT